MPARDAGAPDASFHFPPEFISLLVDAIGRICRYKRDVVTFFQSAGCPSDLVVAVDGVRDSTSKFEMARRVLIPLNQRGDRTLAARREVVKRVVEFEDFSLCWENDRAAARGYVVQVRELVDRKDSVTKTAMRAQAAEAARLALQKEEQRKESEKRAALADVRRDLGALFAESDPWKRGKRFEGVLSAAFEASEIGLREAFTVVGPGGVGVVEQIDGAIELGGHQYLVEAKWLSQPAGPSEVNDLLQRVLSRGEVRGIFISASRYTPAAVQSAERFLQHRVVVLCDLEEIVLWLEAGRDLSELLAEKVTAALMDRNPYCRPTA